MLNTILSAFASLVLCSSACTRLGSQPATSAAVRAAPGSPFPIGTHPGQPVVADFNHDGHVDLVVGFEGRGDEAGKGCVSLLLGDGAGRFTQAGTPRAVGGEGLVLATGHANADGLVDLLAAEHDRFDVTILLGDGRGGLSHAPGSPVAASRRGHPHTHDLAAADMNGDGALDILTTNADDNSVSVLLGDGAGGFTPAPGSPFAAGTHPYGGLTVIDVNADRAMDVIVPNLHGNSVSVLLGDGHGGLAQAAGSPHAVGPRPGYLAAGDLDGNGTADLVVSHDDDPMIDVLLGDGRGGFRPAENSPVRLPRTVWGVALADLSGDGRADIVLGSYQGDALILVSGRGPAHLAAPEPLMLGPAPGRVVAQDVSGDGEADLVVSHFDNGTLSVWLQR